MKNKKKLKIKTQFAKRKHFNKKKYKNIQKKKIMNTIIAKKPANNQRRQ